MKKQRILSMVLAVVMVLGLIPTLLPAFTFEAEATTVQTGTSGIIHYLKPDTYYTMPEKIDTPLTYEFDLYYPTAYGDGVRGGVILGNYSVDQTRCVNVEIKTNGKVRFYVNNQSGKVADILFDTNIRANSFRHIAITIDVATNTASLYVAGAFVESKTHANLTNLPTASEFLNSFMIGGDYRSGNTNYFKGAINTVALYSEIRTAEQIAADAAAAKEWGDEVETLMAAYDLSRQGENALFDRSGNGLDLTYTNNSGMMIENFGGYKIEKKLTAAPETVEAWVWYPTGYGSARGGTFFGNNGASGSTPDIAFEIEYQGHPRYFYTTADGTTAIHEFGSVDVRTGTWEHIVMVHDPANSETRCYRNGELAQTLAYTEYVNDTSVGKQYPVAEYSATLNTETYMFGGDRQAGYRQYYKGYIKEMRVYSDIRTAEEIAADYAGTADYEDENFLIHYQVSQENAYKNIVDLTGNGYDAVYDQIPMVEQVAPLEEYAYSIALVGDTQTIVNTDPTKLQTMYQWIIDNKEEKNIQYVIGLGDITETGVDEGHKNYDPDKAATQWSGAKEAITMMDGILPYSLIRGEGHDGIEYFNQYFGSHQAYLDNIAGFMEEGRIDNVYHTFTVGDTKYMILCLDFGTKDPAIEWANEVIAAHPDYRVIITTHAYLEKDGSLLETGEAYCPSSSYYDTTNNDGDDLWNKLVRKHANIAMVICGHMTCDDVVRSTQIGDHGNVVQQILVDPQNGLDTSTTPRGMVAMLYFSEDGSDVQVQYYSTITDMYRSSSSFTMPIGATEAPSYEDIPEGYLVAKNPETGLYTVVENTYFDFLGGSLRYGDAVAGQTNIRFGYRFAEDFDLTLSNWQWNWGYLDQTGNKLGEEKTSANISNLVITGVPAEYYATNFNVELVFELTLDGVTYTVTDRVRTRSIKQVATGMAANPAESDEARAYAQTVLDACGEN